MSALGGYELIHTPRLGLDIPLPPHALWFHKRSREPICRGQSHQKTGIGCVVTDAASWLLLGEKLTLIQAGGGVLVLFAVFVANFPTLWGASKHWMGFLLNSRARGVRDSSILS